MPPFIPQKRRQSAISNHVHEDICFPKKPKHSPVSKISRTLQDNERFIASLEQTEAESSWSELDSDEFEDVDIVADNGPDLTGVPPDDEECIDWQDAIDTHPANDEEASALGISTSKISKDLELTLDGPAHDFTTNPNKKGPSKRDRQARVSTHRMHVLCLLFHNLVRNGYACDPVTQQILREQLPLTVRHEVQRWRHSSGLDPIDLPQTSSVITKSSRRKLERNRSHRDWGQQADRSETGAPDLNRGPLLRLLKVLANYWKKRFVIVAPSLRKNGYKPLAELKVELNSWRTDPTNVQAHGERIIGIEGFRSCARLGQGSRDIGAQLFTALLRSIGIETRFVASLQPLGYGFTLAEGRSAGHGALDNKDDHKEYHPSLANHMKALENKRASDTVKHRNPGSKGAKTDGKGAGAKGFPIEVDDNSNSDTASECTTDRDDDDDSVIDVTPGRSTKPPKRFYEYMPFPTYWSEVISPISSDVVPVDPFGSVVASNEQDLLHFEPRGMSAERAKIVLAYVVGYSCDGTAKDLTTRYLKHRQWPGVTKGLRLPSEKVSVYKSNGKVSHYQHHCWFERVMRGYERGEAHRTLVDDLEHARLVPAITAKSPKAAETLSSYKASPFFVLERHLRRDEALLPGSEPVKSFTCGKGEQSKSEPVFLRRDVRLCRTAESWHREGRAIKPNSTPFKLVNIRANTIRRKREVEQAASRGGETLIGLFALEQTNLYIAPPIRGGKIEPKNAYGNIDLFVPSMLPKGAVHLPLHNTVKVCKALQIDYAEAVTGFQFGNRVAIPVLTGVVVAQEHQATVIEALKKQDEEKRLREEGRQATRALFLWRKFMMGLRVLHRVSLEYGDDAEMQAADELNPFTNSRHKQSTGHTGEQGPVRESEQDDTLLDRSLHNEHESLLSGGFLLEDEDDSNSGLAAEDGLTIHFDDACQIPSDGNSGSPLPPRRETDGVPTGSQDPLQEELPASSSVLERHSSRKRMASNRRRTKGRRT